MGNRTYAADVVYIVTLCGCGGEFRESIDNIQMLSSPPQQDYVCNKCGSIKRLAQSKWPHQELVLKDVINVKKA